MRVGVISKGSPDYSIDIVCDGLIKILGRQNVALDYVHKSRWGGQYCILMAGVEQENSFDIYDAEILVASTRSVPAAEEWIKRTGKTKVAIVDGEDFPEFAYDPERAKIYFKREYLVGKTHPSNVRPLPFGAIPEAVPAAATIERPVFYLAHPTHPIRHEILKTLAGLGVAIPQDRIEKAEYNKILASSLIGIAPRGNGWDTYRYWELPFFGCALLAQRPGIVIPDNFVDGEEAIFWDDVKDMESKLIGLMKDPEKALRIGMKGREACLKRHLCTNRARAVLEALA